MRVPLLERDLDEIEVRDGVKPVLRASDAVNLAGVDTGRHTLSHTRVSVFLSCHRKFEFEYVQRLETIVEPRYFGLGKAYQKAIEFQNPDVGVRFLNGFEPCLDCAATGYRKTPPVGTPPEDGGAFDMVVPEGLWAIEPPPEAVHLGWTCPTCKGRGYGGEQIAFHSQDSEDRHRVDEAIVRAASTLYLSRYPSAPEGSVREFEYKVRLRSPWTGAYSNTYDLLGYADEVIDTGPDNPLELVENKLVGRVERAQVLSLPLNRQIALERYGLWRATGRPVTRVWYRWMKKPSIQQRGGRKKDRSDAETLDAFIERIAADYEERPDFYLHEEDPKFVTTKDLLRIEADLWEWAEDVRQRMRRGSDGRRRVFDRDTTRCSEYGGCQFLPICTGDPDARALYRVRPKRTVSNESAPEAE